MMPEISLNILDVAQNSVTAGATLIEIGVVADFAKDRLETYILDNGCGMTKEQVEKVTDPFYTTRTTRKVGLGVPFYKMAAEITGGSFSIESEKGKGTRTTAVFVISNIDRMPLGDMAATITSLVGTAPNIDFLFRFVRDGREFVMDTREFRQILGDISLAAPQVQTYMTDYINEGIDSCGGTL